MPRKNKEADKVVDEACLLSLFRQFSPETQTLIINGIKDGRLCKATEVMGEAGIPKSLAERELLKAIRGLPDMKRIMAASAIRFAASYQKGLEVGEQNALAYLKSKEGEPGIRGKAGFKPPSGGNA